MAEVLTRRALNRALLARQLLLERSRLDPAAAVAHLAGMQSQSPQPPYLGLLTRLADFDPRDASALLEDRTLVRATLQRGTIHLLTAADLLAWRMAMAPLTDRFLAGLPYRDALAPLGDELTDAVSFTRDLLHERPRTAQDLTSALAERWPAVDAKLLAQATRFLNHAVQVTPRGLWQRSGPPAFTTVEAWLGRPVDDPPDLTGLLRRYLGAFGPASVLDAQAWAGLARLKDAFEQLRPELVTFQDEHGRELFDLPDAPRPDADVDAPVRLVPEWDNLLLAHADKTRVISDEHRTQVFTVNGIIHPTVLVDGEVAGRWRRTAPTKGAPATITLEPFGPWSKAATRAATAEARRLLATTDPTAAHDVVVAPR